MIHGGGITRERYPMILYQIAFLAVTSVVAFTASAFAVQAVPGPVAGIGLPALAIIGGAYWVGRKFFASKK
jgi:hypothetical protein